MTNDTNWKASASDAPASRASLRSPAAALEPTEAPQPPKRSRHSRNRIVIVFNALMSLMVFAAILACGTVYFGKQRFEEPGPLQTTRSVVIKEGSGLARIAQQLESNGIIDNEFIFRAGVRAYRASSSLKAGEYAFNPGMSMFEVMDTIRSGKGVVYKVTLPEGLTVHQIFQRLAENEVLTGDLPAELPPEGSLLPDTYPFQRGAKRADVVAQMRRAHDKLLAEVWARRTEGLPVKTPEELVTLASIVEKETGKADERPRVAAVFINRLNKGMRLQSDPTILYGLFGGEGRPADRPIYRSDIEKPTPFNTYVIDGLPPSPIANPGRAALEAVANPSRTDELFFVADGTGGHVFAVTLDEHEENVKRWRVIEKQKREEQAKQEADAAAKTDANATDENADTVQTEATTAQ